MNARFAAAAAAVLACTSPPTDTLRGELIGEFHNRVRECVSGNVYALGVMSSVVGYHFSVRADEAAAADPHGRVLVELVGVHDASMSSAAQRDVSGVFSTRSIVSIAPGSCEADAG